MPDGITKEADKVLKAYRHSQDAFNDSIADTEKAMRYVSNNPYTLADQARALKYDKPLLRFNILIPILSTMVGNEQLVRRRALMKPKNLQQANVVDIIQGRWNALNDEQDIEEMLQTVFYDALISKMGGWIQRDFEMTPEGYLDFKYKIVNNMRLFPDDEVRTSDYQLEHCRWIVKEGWEPLDMIRGMFEKLTDEDLSSETNVNWWHRLVTNFKRFTDSSYSGTSNYDKENDRYKILEMQEKIAHKMFRVTQGDNSYFLMEPEKFYRQRKQNGLIKIDETYRDVIHTTTMVPAFENIVVRDEDSKLPVNNFDVFPCFSYGLNSQLSEATSMIDLLLDIQDDVNKGKSQMRDYVVQMLTAITYIDKREKEAIKTLRTKGNQPRQVLELNNMNNKPGKLGPDQIAPEILINTENTMAFSKEISLLNAAMQGQSEKSGESGILFQQKLQRAAAAVNPYYKNLSNLRKSLAKDFVDNFGHVYSELDRVVAVMDDEGKYQNEMINVAMAGGVLNDVSNASIHVELDEGEDNITAREENFDRLLAVYNLIIQANPQIASLLVRELVVQAPIAGIDKFIAVVDKAMADQATAAKDIQELERTKQQLENLSTERGIIEGAEMIDIEKQKLLTDNQKQAPASA